MDKSFQEKCDMIQEIENMGNKRFDIFFDKHIGIGIRWNSDFYDFHLSIALIMFTITIGFGKDKTKS